MGEIRRQTAAVGRVKGGLFDACSAMKAEKKKEKAELQTKVWSSAFSAADVVDVAEFEAVFLEGLAL